LVGKEVRDIELGGGRVQKRAAGVVPERRGGGKGGAWVARALFLFIKVAKTLRKAKEKAGNAIFFVVGKGIKKAP
jgi:hypothetical protein